MSSSPAFTSMEQILQSRDILQEVFAYIKAPVDSSMYRSDSLPSEALDCQRTLSAAARTCKAFLWPASKFLWQDLPSFDAILCVLSSSVKVKTYPPKPPALQVDGSPALCDDTYWTLVEPITDSERSRLKAYLRFTQTLNLRASYAIETAVFTSLFDAGPRTPIAPCLYAIYSSSRWYNMHHALLLLCGPALRELELDLGHLHYLLVRRMPKVLALFRAVAPNIERLVLRASPALPAKARVAVVLGLPYLRSLDFSTVYETMLDHMDLVPILAGLEHLEELVLPDTWDSPTRPYVRGQNQMKPCAGFKKLKKLTVVGGLWSVPLLFAGLPDLRLTELRMVGLKHGCIPSFEEIVQSCSVSLFNSLEVMDVGYILRFRLRGPVAVRLTLAPPEIIAAISPLLALPNIREFSVATEGDCLVQDDDLLKIAEAWTGLTSLCIKYTPPKRMEMSVAPTILGVTCLVNICPNLRNLDIPFVVPPRTFYHVEPTYALTRERYPPHWASLPGPEDGIDSIDVARLVDIMWPLFGVDDSPVLLDPHLFSEDWSTVFFTVAHLQDGWEQVVM